jgi:hypothetical protein
VSKSNDTDRGDMKVFAGHYATMRIILACRTKDDFMAVTRLPKANIYGVTSNAQEIAAAMASVGTPLARNIRSLDGEFVEWQKPSNAEIKRRKELMKQSPFAFTTIA